MTMNFNDIVACPLEFLRYRCHILSICWASDNLCPAKETYNTPKSLCFLLEVWQQYSKPRHGSVVKCRATISGAGSPELRRFMMNTVIINFRPTEIKTQRPKSTEFVLLPRTFPIIFFHFNGSVRKAVLAFSISRTSIAVKGSAWW